ncbi:hypothetical protein OF83DRAFT_1180813, partial [Amylostereum chailletii]
CTHPVFNAPITVASNALATVSFNPHVTVAPNTLALTLALFAPNRHVTGALNLRVTATLNAMLPSPSNPRHLPLPHRLQCPHTDPTSATSSHCHPLALNACTVTPHADALITPNIYTPSRSTPTPSSPPSPRCRHTCPGCAKRGVRLKAVTLVAFNTRQAQRLHLGALGARVAVVLNGHVAVILNDPISLTLDPPSPTLSIPALSPTLAHALVTSTRLPPSLSPNTPPPRSAPAPLPHSTPVPVPTHAHAIVPPPVAKPQCIAHAPRVPRACISAINACTKAGRYVLAHPLLVASC